MRTSVLSRSVIAIASLAIGSVALATAPATAAAPSGVTRDMVLALAQYDRSSGGSNDSAIDNAYAIADRACNVAANDESRILDVNSAPAGGNADGFTMIVGVLAADDSYFTCVFGAIATTDPSFTLTGRAAFDVASASFDRPRAAAMTALSGDVYVTAPVVVPEGSGVTGATFTATGDAARSLRVTANNKVFDKKSKSEKKAAKKKYDSRLKAAKKSYAKALKKAGSSKSKKAAAKKSYSAKKASATTKYKAAIANYKIVKRTTTRTEYRPFSITTGFDYRG